MNESQPKPTPPDGESRMPPPGSEIRQKTIDALCESFARDEMEVEEFEQRVEMAHRADTLDQLRLLLADLPSPTVPAKRGAASAALQVPTAAAELAPRPTLSSDRVADHSLVVGIMGGGGRSGAWIPARNNWAIGVMGGCELDFREAQFGPGVTEVRVFAMWGGVDVIVPPDVLVECSGIGIMGGFDHQQTVPSTSHPDAPILRVTGLAIMGGAGVTVRYPGETARDARLRLKAERKAKKLLMKGK